MPDHLHLTPCFILDDHLSDLSSLHVASCLIIFHYFTSVPSCFIPDHLSLSFFTSEFIIICLTSQFIAPYFLHFTSVHHSLHHLRSPPNSWLLLSSCYIIFFYFPSVYHTLTHLKCRLFIVADPWGQLVETFLWAARIEPATLGLLSQLN